MSRNPFVMYDALKTVIERGPKQDNRIKGDSRFNKNYNFKIQNIGLKKGEKLNEQLSIFKNLKKTKIKDIKITSDPLYQKNELLILLKLIETNTNINFKMAKLKFFLKKEIKA